jgi:SAM-dependent methyltransferase
MFSTTTVPSRGFILSAHGRPIASNAPPGANGTTSRIGRVGYFCAAAVREMVRVLRPGGLLLLTTPNLVWRWSVWLAEVSGLRKFEGIENWMSRGALRRAIVRADGSILGTAGLHILPFQLRPLWPLIRLMNEHGQVLKPMMINQCWIAQKRSESA